MIRFSCQSLSRNLQTLRAAISIAEAGNILCVQNDDSDILQYLEDYFHFTWEVGSAEIAPLVIDHQAPCTSLGDVSRPLLFPHEMVASCAEAWADARGIRIGFTGLMTRERRSTFRQWIRHANKATKAKWTHESRIMSRMWRFNLGNAGVEINATKAGRTWPSKAWDENYYRRMGSTQFALCPSGDFSWTYRVFEAALCGAIPIVETQLPLYQSLMTVPWNADITQLSWDPAVAEHNRRVATQMVTVDHETLSVALAATLT